MTKIETGGNRFFDCPKCGRIKEQTFEIWANIQEEEMERAIKENNEAEAQAEIDWDRIVTEHAKC